MFEFLFKKPGDKPGDAPAGDTGQPVHDASAPSAGKPDRALQAEKVGALAGDEAAAAEFILQSDYSELRLAAAEFIHSPEHLERVHAAIRNTDRRVAKLMQSRLDAIRHHQAELARGQECITQAEALLADEKLTPNHVGDLDRRWSVITAPELAGAFDEVRSRIGQRLEAQVTLQRGVIDSVAALRRLGEADLPAAELAQQLEQLAQAHAAALAAPERATLPRNLVNEFAAEQARVAASIASREQAQAAPAEAPAPAVDEAATAIAEAPQPVKARPPRPAKAPAQPPDQHFLDTVDAMEAALQQGSLAHAGELDKALKDTKGIRLPPALADRLAHARAELKRLSDWARWGGNVSRKELIKAVEQLPEQNLAMSELAKKVGSMRERWKGLDTLSGSAPKSLWERFDAACTAAYAPAAAHFKHLADERHTNAAKAQALVAEVAAEAAKFGGGDWKQLASTVQRLRLAWSHLGAIDRKEKKRLDHEFNAALDALQTPLNEQRKGEVATREELIEQASALNPADRHALDKLRALQEQWQEHARALPLERKAEQALWQRFRAACDAVFAKRKESAHAADVERRAHQHAKEAICARLEAVAPGIDAAGAGKLLREAATEWHAIGPVPRANEAKLDKRYHAAQAALQHQADQARRQAGLALASALRDKLRLVQALESAIAAAGDAPDGQDWQTRYSALPALAPEYEKALRSRFDAGIKALGEGREAYAARLEQNRSALLNEVLRMEIALGIDSGSEFARERLKLQVEVLQSSLKSGQKPASQAAQFVQLCAMPALVDARTASRLEHLFTRLGKEAR
jgi:hypothetical protein